MDAHNASLEALNGALERIYKPVIADSFISKRSWIRIRIKVKSCIRIRKKVMQIGKPVYAIKRDNVKQPSFVYIRNV